MTRTRLLIWAFALLFSGLSFFPASLTGLSPEHIAQQRADLPPRDSYYWDTTKIYASAKDVYKLKRAKDSVFYAWFKSKPGTPQIIFLRDSLMWQGQEELSVLIYKTILRGAKDQQHFYAFNALVLTTFQMEKERLVYLFNQFPATLQKSATGKKISQRLHTAFGQNEGRNIQNILTAARATSVAGKTQSIASLMNDSKQLYVLVFGASWCGPCRYQDKLLHQTIAPWDQSRFSIIHLSIDTNRKKWETHEKNTGYERTAYLLPGGFEGALVKQLGVAGVPRYIVVDGKGNVVLDNIAGINKIIKKLETVSKG